MTTAAAFDWEQPVKVRFGAGCADSVAEALGGRPALVLAFAPARALGLELRWRRQLGDRLLEWIDIADGLSSLDRARRLSRRVWPWLARRRDAVVVAVGGGTTLDLAKLVRCRPRGAGSSAGVDANGDAGIEVGFDGIESALRRAAPWPALDPAPLWLLPTTAGTGSEVTRWATVWDTEATPPCKRSFDEPFGYAERAFVDPDLTLSCPEAVTRDCALDTLAHALEAIWNRHANPVSDALAVRAAKRVVAVLPALLRRGDDRTLRAEMSLAALEAGLAFAQTRTALAHALSYAVTLEQGVPHGQACALWLPTAWRLAAGREPRVDRLLAELFDGAGVDGLVAWLSALPLDARPEAYGIVDAAERVSVALSSPRGRNFIAAV